MEFRYRAIDYDRPRSVMDMGPTQFPNYNSSFLLPMLSLSVAGKFHSREVIQREIEKEQIHQEIIIAEAARKRELLAEVLKEMEIEREMALRGVVGMAMLLEEKLTMLINQKKLPPNMKFPSLQQINEATETSIMESNKEKFTVLERADFVGAKRKADDTQTCLNEHVQEKKHKAKESASNAKSMFWCDICKVGTYTEILMRNHELGKKHKAAITKQQNESPETNVEAQKIEGGGVNNKEERFWCKICNCWTNSEQVMKTHWAGKKHKALFQKFQSKA